MKYDALAILQDILMIVGTIPKLAMDELNAWKKKYDFVGMKNKDILKHKLYLKTVTSNNKWHWKFSFKNFLIISREYYLNAKVFHAEKVFSIF